MGRIDEIWARLEAAKAEHDDTRAAFAFARHAPADIAYLLDEVAAERERAERAEACIAVALGILAELEEPSVGADLLADALAGDAGQVLLDEVARLREASQRLLDHLDAACAYNLPYSVLGGEAAALRDVLAGREGGEGAGT